MILQFIFKSDNIQFIFLILFVLKLDKFKEVREEQWQNISLILVTLFFIKLGKFKIVKEE